MKAMIIDVETTGLDPAVHGIWELAYIVCDWPQLNCISEANHLVFQPDSEVVWEPKALEMCGKRLDNVIFNSSNAYSKFIYDLRKHVDCYDCNDKMLFVAYNAQFDERFVREWFKSNGDKYFGSYFIWPSIDVAQLALLAIGEKRLLMPKFTLGDAAVHFKMSVEAEGLHEGWYDVELARQIASTSLAIIGGVK